MQKGICYIIGAGDFDGTGLLPKDGDFVIAADGGYRYLSAYSVNADIVVGDFDSLGKPPEHPNVVLLNREKDETDLYEAAKIGIEKGYKDFYFYGATGGRLDHTIANIQLINELANLGLRGVLVGHGEELTVIKNSFLDFAAGRKGRISVFSLCETSYGVTLQGLKYPLTDYTMTSRFPIGVSNEFTGAKAKVEVKNGELLIIYAN